MKHAKVLLTGFNPFGASPVNSSEQVVRAIAAKTSRPWLLTEILPTEFAAAGDAISQFLATHRPAICLCLGLNERADAIMIERCARNLSHADIPDNAGFRPSQQQIVPSGPATYHPTVPLERIAQVLRQHDIPTGFSDSAGSFVCNHVFYTAASEINRLALPTKFGFIHLPPSADSDPAACGMPLEKMINAIELCLDACIDTTRMGD